MERNDQVDLLLRILKRFSGAGILDQCMLIGSWCLHFYRFEFKKADLLPALRTMDVDFLIPDSRRIKKTVDVPELLKEEGFIPIFSFTMTWFVISIRTFWWSSLFPKWEEDIQNPGTFAHGVFMHRSCGI